MNTEFNRDPSTTASPRYSSACVKSDSLKSPAWQAMFAAARAAFKPEISGLVGANEERAFFQIWGDPTVYSIRITDDERACFHGPLPAQHVPRVKKAAK